MYIPKRWIAPAALSLMLLLAILVTLVTNLRFERSSSTEGDPVQLAAATVPMQDPSNPSCLPTPEQAAFNQFLETLPPAAPNLALTPEQQAFQQFLLSLPPAGTHSESVGNNSPNSQFSAGSWGDIGQQWRDVQVNAPVVNNHVSNEGNGNTNNLVTGNNNNVNSGQININITSPATTPPPGQPVTPVSAPVTTAPPATTPPTTATPPTSAPATTVVP